MRNPMADRPYSTSKHWNASTLRLEDVLLKVGRVGDMNAAQVQHMYDLINRYGLAVLQHRPVDEPVEELHTLGTLFGRPVVHDRADERGLVVVAELSGYEEFVGASAGPHLMHTGGTFMPWADVPKIVLLQCEVQARVGGRSMVAAGAAAFRHLREHHPDALELLTDPNVFAVRRSASGTGKHGGTGGVRKAVFDTERLGERRVWLTFRFDGQIKLDLQPDAASEAFDKLLHFFNRSENQLDFRLEPNQIMICDNTSVVHARTAFQHGSGRKLNRLQIDGTVGDLVFGFEQ